MFWGSWPLSSTRHATSHFICNNVLTFTPFWFDAIFQIHWISAQNFSCLDLHCERKMKTWNKGHEFGMFKKIKYLTKEWGYSSKKKKRKEKKVGGLIQYWRMKVIQLIWNLICLLICNNSMRGLSINYTNRYPMRYVRLCY